MGHGACPLVPLGAEMMKLKKLILLTVSLLFLVFAVIVYILFNGTPWGKMKHEANMQSYLDNKYQTEFVIKRTTYNYLSETYQAYAYPKGHSDVEFMVQEDMESKAGYADSYPEAIWESELSNEIKAKIRELFPKLNEDAFQAMRIVDRGESYGRGIPTYEHVPASHLDTSISIKIIGSWEQMDQSHEIEKMKELILYLKSIHFPVLVEVWYIEDHIYNINEDTKAFFISEYGNIIEG